MAGLLDFALMARGLLNPYVPAASPYGALQKGLLGDVGAGATEGARIYQGGANQLPLPLEGGKGQWQNTPRLYHGTNRTFDEFKGRRVYLTSNPDIASKYSSYRATASDPGNPVVIPVEARFRNPLVIDMKGKSALYADDMAGGSVNDLVRKGGHDAIIYKNMMDIYSGQPQDQYIAIGSNTLRSAITHDPMR